jgi:hypothetical protein
MEPREIEERDIEWPRWGDELLRRAVMSGERGAERVVASDDFGEGVGEGVDLELAAE